MKIKNNVQITVFTAVITAVVVGGGMYKWQLTQQSEAMAESSAKVEQNDAFERFQVFDNVIDEIVEKTLKYANTDYDYREFIVLAESGLRDLGEDLDEEYLEEKYGSSELEEQAWAKLPKGYTAYRINLSGESGYPIFLHFEGEICEEDACGNQERWYGPF